MKKGVCAHHLWFKAAAVLVCAPLLSCSSDDARNVTLLYCDKTGFDENNKCLKIDRIGADLKIIPSRATQEVAIWVTKNDGLWRESFQLDTCSVVEADEWECTIHSGAKPDPTIDTFATHHGHFYRSLVGGGLPNWYSSGVSGWCRFWMQLGVLSPEKAQSYE
jgi:hypothetical protein